MHFVFYDQGCPLCQHSVEFIRKQDRSNVFNFAPLSGEVAAQKLQGPFESLRNENSLIFFENWNTEKERLWLRGRAVFRICWLLGGKWKLLGLFTYLPGADLVYRLIARHRHIFFKK